MPHYRNEQPFGRWKRLVLEADDIAGVRFPCISEAKNLLAAREGLFVFAELGPAPNAVIEFDFDQLVDDSDVWSIRRRRKRGADAKGIDWRSTMKQGLDSVLIQVTRDKNQNIFPANIVESLASPNAVGQNVAAIEADTGWFAAEGNDLVDGPSNIVGVREEGRLLRKDIQKIPKCFGFVVMRHDPRVGLCSINRDAKAVARIGVGRSCAAAKECGACGEDTGFDAMSSPRAEFNDGPPAGGSGYASRFAGNEGLEMNNGKEAGFDELRFGDRSSDAEQRLARKEDRALREGPNIACEVELSEIVEEVGVDMMEHGQSADIGYFFRRKGNVCKEVESLFKTSETR